MSKSLYSILSLVILILVGGLSFWGGKYYGEKKGGAMATPGLVAVPLNPQGAALRVPQYLVTKGEVTTVDQASKNIKIKKSDGTTQAILISEDTFVNGFGAIGSDKKIIPTLKEGVKVSILSKKSAVDTSQEAITVQVFSTSPSPTVAPTTK